MKRKNRNLRFAAILKAMLHEQFTLERRVEAFAHRVIVTVADRPHRWTNASLFAALPERDRSVLAALV